MFKTYIKFFGLGKKPSTTSIAFNPLLLIEILTPIDLNRKPNGLARIKNQILIRPLADIVGHDKKAEDQLNIRAGQNRKLKNVIAETKG